MLADALADRLHDHIARPRTEAERHRLAHCLLDWCGVAIAGTADPEFRKMASGMGAEHRDRLAVAADGAGTSTRIFLNAFAGHVLDYDDTHLGYWGHPAATVVPVAFAIAETCQVSGERLLSALSAGMQASMLIGLMAGERHRAAGWHTSSTAGIFGAVAASAVAADIPASRWPDAFRLCAVQASGLSAAFGSAGKPLQVARAAQLGFESCQLAHAGLDGPRGVIEGGRGIVATHAFESNTLPDVQEAAVNAILFKTVPACFGVQAPAVAARTLVTDRGDAARSLVWARVEIAEHFLPICTISVPRNVAEARFSVAFVVALALSGHPVSGADALKEEMVADLRLRALTRCVTVCGCAALAPSAARLTVQFAGERSPRVCEVDLATTAGAGLAEERARLSEKFLQLASPVIGAVRAAQLRRAVLDVESARATADLLHSLYR
jgi:2-methylcitrate dehydratase PrpD